MKKIFVSVALVLANALCFAQGPARDVPAKAVEPAAIEKTSDYKYYSGNDKGFWAGFDLGSGASFTGVGTGVPLDFCAQLGYRFNQYIKLGVGGGMRYNFISDNCRDNSQDPETFKNWSFPLYLDVRGNFFSQDYRDFVPFWRFDIGYTFNDGFMFSPGLGLSFGSEIRNHFTLGISYVGQMARVVTCKDPRTTGNGYLNQFQLKLGYEF